MMTCPNLEVYHYLDIDQTGHIAPHELYRIPWLQERAC